MSKKLYPKDWKEIAERIKAKHDWRCERTSCRHPHDPENGYTLTVHHLVMIPALCEDWNLAALCQRCHLSIQARINMDQLFFDDIITVSEWFKPHLEGYLDWVRRGRPVYEAVT